MIIINLIDWLNYKQTENLEPKICKMAQKQEKIKRKAKRHRNT